MADAVAAYARHRAGPDGWILGRLVVPAARLGELEEEGAARFPRAGDGAPWRISALVGEDVAGDARRVAEFDERHARRAVIDAVETKASSADEVHRIGALLRDAIGRAPVATYYELPVAGEPRRLIAAARDVGGRAKVRTGGVTADAFPAADDLVRFVHECVEAAVPFKATAGLHHPVRARHPLTYEPGSATAMMYGYLNVWLAAALLHRRAPLDDARAALEETDALAFRFEPDAIAWRGWRLSADDLAALRANVAISFGSCSFEEPVGELRGALRAGC
jgi:hypothetical protein